MAETFKKNRPGGITFLAVLFLVTGVTGTISNFYVLQNPPQFLLSNFKYAPQLFATITSLISLLISMLSFIIGIQLLRLKESWRKVALGKASFMLAYWSITPLFVNQSPLAALLYSVPLIDIFTIFFLSRPQVKATFVHN